MSLGDVGQWLAGPASARGLNVEGMNVFGGVPGINPRRGLLNSCAGAGELVCGWRSCLRRAVTIHLAIISLGRPHVKFYGLLSAEQPRGEFPVSRRR